MEAQVEQKRAVRSSFPLRLPKSIKTEAAETARQEKITLNHFITLAVVEKLTRMGNRETEILPPALLRSPSPLKPGTA